MLGWYVAIALYVLGLVVIVEYLMVNAQRWNLSHDRKVHNTTLIVTGIIWPAIGLWCCIDQGIFQTKQIWRKLRHG